MVYVNFPEDLMNRLIDEAMRRGASYVEVRFQKDAERFVSVKNGEPQLSSSWTYGGLSIRVLVDGMWGFSSTNDLRIDSAMGLLDKAMLSARAAAKIRRRPVTLGKGRLARLKYEVPTREPPSNVDNEELVRILRDLDNVASREPRMKVRIMHVNIKETSKAVVTSDGAYVVSYIPRVLLFGTLVAQDPVSGSVQRNIEIAGSGGMEVIRGAEDEVAREVSAIRDVLNKAKPLPHDERMDVVLGPELAGIMVHESVGHPLELDRIMGREGAEAGESYARPSDLGELRLGSEYVTIIDDPTIPGSYGFYLADEECVVARPRFLVSNGVVTEFLLNREFSSYIGRESNAAARASEYDKEPIPRMANTYLAPGDWKPEDIIRDTRRGLFFVSYTEWNIDDKRWFGRYGGFEVYLVENGELKGMVRNPFIEVDTRTLWSSVDAVANDLRFFPGTCGKGNPMQGVPVYLGGVTFRVRNAKVLKAPSA